MRVTNERLIEVLRDASGRITEETWTTHALAVDSEGIPVPVTDPDAVRWCALGSVKASTRKLYPDLQDAWLMETHCHTALMEGMRWGDLDATAHLDDADMMGWDIEDYNDDLASDYSDVLDLFDASIKELSTPDMETC